MSRPILGAPVLHDSIALARCYAQGQGANRTINVATAPYTVLVQNLQRCVRFYPFMKSVISYHMRFAAHQIRCI
jgi:hypothetical protein